MLCSFVLNNQNMEMQALTFDQLPSAVGILSKKLDSLLSLIQGAQQPPIEQDEIFTVSQAAAFLKMAEPTLYAKCSKKEIPHSKRGGRSYFSKHDLIEWLKEGKVKTNTEISAEATAYTTRKTTTGKAA